MDAPVAHEKAAVMEYIFQRVDPASYLGKKKEDNYLERAFSQRTSFPPPTTYQNGSNIPYQSNSVDSLTKSLYSSLQGSYNARGSCGYSSGNCY